MPLKVDVMDALQPFPEGRDVEGPVDFIVFHRIIVRTVLVIPGRTYSQMSCVHHGFEKLALSIFHDKARHGRRVSAEHFDGYRVSVLEVSEDRLASFYENPSGGTPLGAPYSSSR